MTDQHPITPPPELVQQWHKEACKDPYHGGTFFESKTLKHISTQAARWGADQQLKLDAEQIAQAHQAGADQELEACCHLLRLQGFDVVDDLRIARRPKPPSLKEQALLAIDTAVADGRLSPDVSNVVRRALEQLDD